MPPPPPDVHYKKVVSLRQWRFHYGHSILSWFSGNEELFKERDQKDDEFLDRLKEFKIDSTDPQSEKVRKPNNEGWLTSSDVLFQSIQWPVETSKFGSCGQFLPGKGGGGGDSRGRGEKMEGRLPDHKQICRKFTFTCFSMFGYVQFLFSLCAFSCPFSLFLMSSYLTELLMLSWRLGRGDTLWCLS